jgi:hypothetical protein
MDAGGVVKDSFAAINTSKANFDDIYTQDDPRGYFSVLGALDYMIPDVAEPVVRQILGARTRRHASASIVLDLGCSYGINAAVHRFPLTFTTLRARYARHEMAALSAEEVERLDRRFYASWPDIGLARFIGLDASAPAIRYATSVGLLDRGVVADLEADDLAPDDAAVVRNANVVLSTGCVGYVTENTYRRLLRSMDEPPWVISFVLRMFPYESLAETLGQFGLATERLSGATFVQRRFRDLEEFEKSLAILASRGIDTTGFEADGLFQADLFVSRPAADVLALSLDEMVTVTSGRHRPIGTRYVQVDTAGGLQIALEP